MDASTGSQAISDLGLPTGAGRIHHDRWNHSDCVVHVPADNHVARAAHRCARNPGLLDGAREGRKIGVDGRDRRNRPLVIVFLVKLLLKRSICAALLLVKSRSF
jgi:hypothetical protein